MLDQSSKDLQTRSLQELSYAILISSYFISTRVDRSTKRGVHTNNEQKETTVDDHSFVNPFLENLKKKQKMEIHEIHSIE